MKKKALRLLALVLALMLAAPAALAGTYEIFGDGTKKWITAEHKDGKTYTYYDIYSGAKTRDNLRDPDTFMRTMLTRPVKALKDYPNDSSSVAHAWDTWFLDFFSDGIKERFRGDTLLKAFEKYNRDINKTDIFSASGDAQQLDQAIRGALGSECHKVDSHLNANSFKPITGLKELGIKGPSYYTMNIAMRNGTAVICYGTIFYDFQPLYVEDKKVADSAVGSETDPQKLKGKRGFETQESGPKAKRDCGVTNNTDVPVTQKVGVHEEVSTSVTNSSGSSSSTNIGIMAGVETESEVKFPLLGGGKLKLKAEFRTNWIATTTKGHSTTDTKKTSYSNEVSVTVPPHTHVTVDLMSEKATYNIAYDYPMALTYKAANYVIFDQDNSFVACSFGNSNDAGNTMAFNNLRNRMEHRKDSGYEAMHSNGRPLDYTKMRKDLEGHYWYLAIAEYLPMSVTGGSLGVSGESLNLVVRKPMPVQPVKQLNVETGARNIKLGAGEKLDLYNAYEIAALDGGMTGEDGSVSGPMACYGFEDDEHGDWVACDKDGNEVSDGPFTVEDGRKLVAGAEEGEGYVKFLLDEDSYPYIDVEASDFENANLVYRNSLNAQIGNDTLVKVSVLKDLAAFNGKVELSGSIGAAFNEEVDLRDLTVKVLDAQGQELIALDRPLIWRVDGAETDSSYTASAAGEHKVTAVYGGVESNAVTLAVEGAAEPTSLKLRFNTCTMTKGASAQNEAIVEPANADTSKMVWTSSNEKAITVDQTGLMTCQSLGTAIITCTLGSLTAECAVSTESRSGAEALTQGKVALKKGGKFVLGAPAGTSGTWSVKDSSVAAVTPEGVVTGKALGETELVYAINAADKHAKFLGKEIYGKDSITVPLAVRKAGDLVKKVVPADKKLTLAVGEQYKLTAALKPAKALDKEVYFASDSPNVATVDDEGVITAVGPGKAAITVTSASGKSAKATVTVADSPVSLKLTAKKLALIAGEVKQIGYTVTPEIIGYKPIFVSKNPKIATVDEDGKVTGVKKGKTSITVYLDAYKNTKATCKVTVK